MQIKHGRLPRLIYYRGFLAALFKFTGTLGNPQFQALVQSPDILFAFKQSPLGLTSFFDFLFQGSDLSAQ